MTLKLRALGLALGALLVLGAMAASAASAKFDSEVEHTLISGDQPAGKPHTFTVNAGTTTCKVAKFSGTSVGAFTGTSWTSEDLAITPEYRECPTIVLGESHDTHVKTNGCIYTFHAGETTEAGTKVDGSTDIVCPAGKVVEWEITGANICKITFPPQNNVAGITYHNTGTGATRDVDWIISITTLTYTQDGIFCPGNNFMTPTTFTNGKYSGEVTLVGTNTAGTQVGIWVT